MKLTPCVWHTRKGGSSNNIYETENKYIMEKINITKDRRGGRVRMVVGFRTTYAISAYHH